MECSPSRRAALPVRPPGCGAPGSAGCWTAAAVRRAAGAAGRPRRAGRRAGTRDRAPAARRVIGPGAAPAPRRAPAGARAAGRRGKSIRPRRRGPPTASARSTACRGSSSTSTVRRDDRPSRSAAVRTRVASSSAGSARGVGADVAITREVSGRSGARISCTSLSRMMPMTSGGPSGCQRRRCAASAPAPSALCAESSRTRCPPSTATYSRRAGQCADVRPRSMWAAATATPPAAAASRSRTATTALPTW